MPTHDPRRVLETLRNHLTQPETNVAFLFGAGTSCSVRVAATPEAAPGEEPIAEPVLRSLIPNVAELTAICIREIQKLDPEGEAPKFRTALDLITQEIQPGGRPANIEDVLSCVRRKLQAVGVSDTLSGLTLDDLTVLEQTIRRTIAAQVNPDRSSFPERLPHEEFARWIARMPRSHPVEVFTTNYDVLLETALEAERVPSFDGFVGCNRPFFCHESLIRPDIAPGVAWTRLWKIHGSINWQLDTVRGRKRVIRVEPSNEGEMIMPSHHKYDESRKQPYTALLDRLTRVLDRDDTLLVVCGYSFSDDHINAIIFDALDAKQRPHVVALQYIDPEPGGVLAERAKRSLNLMVLGPRHAYVGGAEGDWALADPHEAAVLAQAFQPDEPADGAPAGAGQFLLGDFAKLSAFLASVTTPS